MAGKVILGDFTFEIGPRNQIDYTSPRNIIKLDIPGTSPKYQDMGEDEHTIAWSGVFEGKSAQSECQKIERIKSEGKEVKFISGNISKTVRIKDFPYSVIRDDLIAYSITLIEIQHDPQASTSVVTVQANNPESKPAAAIAVKKLTYTVRKGDTLWGIAQKHLKNGNRWTEIAKENNIKDPRKLQIGTVLTLPSTSGGNAYA